MNDVDNEVEMVEEDNSVLLDAVRAVARVILIIQFFLF